MLMNVIIQYALFWTCACITMLEPQRHQTIETHIYHSSVTLLLALVYLAIIIVVYRLYSYITDRNAAFNPDFDIFSVRRRERDDTLTEDGAYKHILEELREMDPEVDFGFTDNADEKRETRLQQLQAELNNIARRAEERPANATEANSVTGSITGYVTERGLRAVHGTSQQENAGGCETYSGIQPQVNDENERRSVIDTKSVKSFMQIIPKQWYRGNRERDHLLEDLNFYLSVYGYGVSIFILYYAVDMVVLTPSLSIICGLTLISTRDMLSLYMTSNANTEEESMFVSKTISMVSFVLQVIALVEMFFSDAHIHDENLITSSPSYIFFTYVFPLAACIFMFFMPRSCSAGRHVRRAFPVAVMIACFMVIWIKTIDIFVARESGLGETSDNPFDYPVDSIDVYDSATDVNPANESRGGYDGVVENEGLVIQMMVRPIAHNLPLISIAVEPLLRLALTFTVITGAVNHKTIEITAIMTFIVAYKQLNLQEGSLAKEHVYRAFVISGCALIFSLMRYTNTFRNLLMTR